MTKYFKIEPYSDEEICSLIIRSLRRTGLSQADFARWHFNLPPTQINSIGNLVPHVAELVGCTPRHILQKHTLVPYGTAGLPLAASRRYTIDLTTGRTPEFADQLGKLGLRWCETCVKVELSTLGESYWHRCHLLPGVCTCAIHGTPLFQWAAPYPTVTIKKTVTFWMEQMLPHELAGTLLRFPSVRRLLHQVSKMSSSALKGRRALESAQPVTQYWRQVFDPGFVHFSGCNGTSLQHLPPTTSRILTLISQHHLEKLGASKQLELFL